MQLESVRKNPPDVTLADFDDQSNLTILHVF